MANQVAIIAKIARNLDQLGYAYTWVGTEQIVVTNGANALNVTYVGASIQSPMGGIDPSVSPFLGIGVGNPGQLKITSSIHTAGTIADVIDGVIAITLFHELSGFANDIILSNDNASFTARILGSVDVLGLGQ